MTTELVWELVIFDFRGLQPILLGSFVDGKVRQFDQFVPGFEGSTAVRFVRFELFGQQFQQVRIYVSRHDLTIFLGFEFHVCQWHGIDVKIANGGFGCEFVGLFWCVISTPFGCLDYFLASALGMVGLF